MRSMVQYLELDGTFTCPDNANDNENSYNQPANYKLPEAVQDPTTILAGTRNFSPDDWEVFYLE